jgi:hypothetical protein
MSLNRLPHDRHRRLGDHRQPDLPRRSHLRAGASQRRASLEQVASSSLNLSPECNTIMSDSTAIVRERQLAIRRELDRRGIALKVVSLDSKIPYSTLLSYFPEPGSRDPAQMPSGVLYALCGHLPDELLSLLLPDGRRIVTVAEAVDHDELCAAMEEWLATKSAAHHPESPAGREISNCEDAILRGKFAEVKAAA